MSNHFIITLYSIIFVLSIVQVTISLAKHRNKPIMKYYFIFAFSALAWQTTNILYYAITDLEICDFIYGLYLPFTLFTSVFLFRVFYEFYNCNNINSFKWLCLYMIPTITMILAILFDFSDFSSESFLIGNISINIKKFWHSIHVIFTYTITTSTYIMVAKKCLVSNKYVSIPSYIFIISLIITMIFDLVFFFDLILQQPNVSLISSVANLYLLYYALNYGDKHSFLVQVQKQIFERLGEGVFILDQSGDIIGLNKSAEIIFENKICKDKIGSFNDIESHMITSLDKEESSSCSIEGSEVFISDKIYNLKQNGVLSKSGSEVGTFLILTDITKYKQLISRLEDCANFDSVTGLFNRHAFELEKKRLNDKMIVPFTIIVGDLNSLKYVNDTFGHDAGDDYIRLIARVLLDSIPSTGKGYRIGGDEFVILLPNINASQASEIIYKIENTVSLIRRFPYEVSIALGRVTINKVTENIENAIAIADEAMYEKKRKMKNKIIRENI